MISPGSPNRLSPNIGPVLLVIFGSRAIEASRHGESSSRCRHRDQRSDDRACVRPGDAPSPRSARIRVRSMRRLRSGSTAGSPSPTSSTGAASEALVPMNEISFAPSASSRSPEHSSGSCSAAVRPPTRLPRRCSCRSVSSPPRRPPWSCRTGSSPTAGSSPSTFAPPPRPLTPPITCDERTAHPSVRWLIARGEWWEAVDEARQEVGEVALLGRCELGDGLGDPIVPCRTQAGRASDPDPVKRCRRTRWLAGSLERSTNPCSISFAICRLAVEASMSASAEPIEPSIRCVLDPGHQGESGALDVDARPVVDRLGHP